MNEGKKDKTLIGVAGEYYVAAELSRRGYIASLTSKNTKSIDLLASNQCGEKGVSIQIKTNSNGSKTWILNKKDEEANNRLFYVFVTLQNEKHPEFYVVPGNIVVSYIKEKHNEWISHKKRDGQDREDGTIRKFSLTDDFYKDKWEVLGLDD